MIGDRLRDTLERPKQPSEEKLVRCPGIVHLIAPIPAAARAAAHHAGGGKAPLDPVDETGWLH